MAKLLINDGYVFKGTIPASGPWPEVNVQYRPALSDRVEQYFEEAAKGDESRRTAASKLLVEHLRSWDVTDDNDKPAPITAATLRAVPHPIRNRLIDLVTGYAGKQQAGDEKNSV